MAEWSWQGGGRWHRFAASVESNLEVGYRKLMDAADNGSRGGGRVRVDAERFIDLTCTPFQQCRYDNERRRRNVRRIAIQDKRQLADENARKNKRKREDHTNQQSAAVPSAETARDHSSAALALSDSAAPPTPPKRTAVDQNRQLVYIGRHACVGGASAAMDASGVAAASATNNADAKWQQVRDGFVGMLKALEANERQKGDQMRANVYSKAANAFRDHSKGALRNGKQAQAALKGVGKKIAAKFDEFLASGTLDRVERDRENPAARALAALTSVAHVGPVLARQLMARTPPVDSVEALRAAVERGDVVVTPAVRVGLKHHADLCQRIPRAEVTALKAIVERAAAELDPRITVQVLGSYRRGAADSGDIDCLITHPLYTRKTAYAGGARAGADAYGCGCANPEQYNYVSRLVAVLKREGFLIDDLVNGKSKYMGVCRMPATGAAAGAGDATGRARRIDMLAIPREEWACAVTYFTGSGAFNRRMRAHATERGFTLNEHALCPLESADRGKGKGTPVDIADERALFAALGLAWVAPADRELGK